MGWTRVNRRASCCPTRLSIRDRLQSTSQRKVTRELARTIVGPPWASQDGWMENYCLLRRH